MGPTTCPELAGPEPLFSVQKPREVTWKTFSNSFAQRANRYKPVKPGMDHQGRNKSNSPRLSVNVELPNRSQVQTPASRLANRQHYFWFNSSWQHNVCFCFFCLFSACFFVFLLACLVMKKPSASLALPCCITIVCWGPVP